MKEAPISGYPLQWPPGRHVIPPAHRDRSNFRTTPGKARDFLIDEVRRLGGTDLVISTNIPLKKDGTPYAGGYRLDDEAVAAYFTYYGKKVCFACDRWWTLAENLHAIGKTIEALRGIARWGTGDMLDSAVSGFAALPAPDAKRDWWEILGVEPKCRREDVKSAYRALASRYHPDKPGGSHEKMAELNAAQDAALKERVA